MSNSFGQSIKMTLFGQSHGPAIGVVVDGLPAGEAVDMSRLGALLRRRAPGDAPWKSARSEQDTPIVLSGLMEGYTCGAPLCIILENRDARAPGDANEKKPPRPSHADFAAYMRDGRFADLRGGGQFSGRLTAAMCAAGGVALQILERRGVTVGAHVYSVGNILDAPFPPADVTAEMLRLPGQRAFPVCDEQAGKRMREAIAQAAQEEDSLGGVVECGAVGLPAGVGGNWFGGLESRLAEILFAIPAVKGVEFGMGFAAAGMRGSVHNDPFIVENGAVRTAANRHGGILGGITTGMPIVFSVAFKPTPSIGREQQSVDLDTMQPALLRVASRNDACIAPRAVPVVEAAAAFALLDCLYESKKGSGVPNE